MGRYKRDSFEKEYMKALGKSLQTLRKNKEWTLIQVAEFTGISKSAISHWERGEQMPDALELQKLANIYEVKVDDIFPSQ